MRDQLRVELDERDYAKAPFSADELRALFRGRDPRDFVNPKSPAFKAMGLKGRELGRDEAIELMAREPNLIKRPLVAAGRVLLAGFDKDELRRLMS